MTDTKENPQPARGPLFGIRRVLTKAVEDWGGELAPEPGRMTHDFVFFKNGEAFEVKVVSKSRRAG
jgi:hypothetical protein